MDRQPGVRKFPAQRAFEAGKMEGRNEGRAEWDAVERKLRDELEELKRKLRDELDEIRSHMGNREGELKARLAGSDNNHENLRKFEEASVSIVGKKI